MYKQIGPVDLNGHNTDRVYPLGANQRRFVLAERFGNARYMLSFVHRVEGDLDLARMRGAANALVLRHAALRTDFRLVNADYVAVVHECPAFRFHVIDVGDDEFETFRRAALPLVMDDVDVGRADSLVRFIVSRVPGGSLWRVCFVVHHAISDGVSSSLAMQELFQLYDGQALPPCASYYDFAFSEDQIAAQGTYWATKLANAPNEVVATPDVEPAAESLLGAFVSDNLDLDPEAFRRLVDGTGASKFGCLAAAYAIGLMRLTGEAEVLFAFQSAGRHTVNAPNTVFGPFSNTLIIVARAGLAQSFSALARQLTAQTQEAVQNEAPPFDRTVRLLPRPPEFSLNSFPKELVPEAAGLKISTREFLDRQTEFALNLRWSQDGQAMVGRAFYDAGRFSSGRMRDFLRAQKFLLQAGLQAPDGLVADLLDALSGRPSTLSDTYLVPPAQTVVDMFEANAQACPDAIAITTTDGTVSYGALFSRSHGFATAFGQAGAVSGDRVVILAQRGPELVAAVLGAARAGVGFAVLDATYPEDRLRQQIAMLQPRFAICLDGSVQDWLADLPGLAVLAAAPMSVSVSVQPCPRPVGRLMYYLFTSGTTGVPKCIGHGLEALTFYITWAISSFDVTPGDCVTMLSGLNHDPVMRDIFLPLASGATLAIPESAELADPRRLRAFLGQAKANILHLTPPLGRLLAIEAREAELSHLRLIVWGGDELPGAQVRQFRRLAPEAEQVNLYGTSETPQAAALYRLPARHPATWRSTPIGTSVEWVRCDCVTADGRICGPGEVGELRVTMPFPVEMISPDALPTQAAQKTVHMTGDRAFVMPEGDLVFVGRRDDQIKIRGFRVELGDITAVLRAIPGVRQTIALTEPKEDGSQRIVAWCEVDPAMTTTADLRRSLKRRLPDHMIPERISLIDRMPLLANGKIDRRALHAAPEAVPTAAPSTEPMTAAELRIADIYARASASKVTDVSQSLVDLGADSLSMIGARLGLESLGIDLRDGWDELSIANLAELLPQGGVPRRNWLRLASVETFIVMRSVAIFLVVALHMHWFGYGGGATDLLFVIAGLTFATYLARPILEHGRTRQAWALLGKILLIGFPVMLAVFGSQILLGKPAHPSTILFFANLIPHGAAAPDDGRIVWLWYIHSYFQVFLFLTLLLTVPRVQSAVRRDPFRAAVVAVIGAAAAFTAVATFFGALDRPIAHLSPLAMSPLHAFILVALGLALALADTSRRRIIVVVCTVAVAAMDIVLFASASVTILVAGMLILMFVPSLRLPALAVHVMTVVSGASFFIYLMHNPLAFVAAGALPMALHPIVLTFGTILISVGLWRLWQPLVRRINLGKGGL